MTLLPVLPVAGDAYYFGSTGMFNILTLNIGQQGNWTGTYAWEYWNGSAWVVLTGLTDNTVGFTAGTSLLPADDSIWLTNTGSTGAIMDSAIMSVTDATGGLPVSASSSACTLTTAASPSVATSFTASDLCEQ